MPDMNDVVTKSKTVSGEMIDQFADVTGDDQTLHVGDDETVAESTPFEGRIAHGMLIGGMLGDAVADLSDGTVIWKKQTLEWVRPVRPGDEIEINVELLGDEGSERQLIFIATDDDGVVAMGEGTVGLQVVDDV